MVSNGTPLGQMVIQLDLDSTKVGDAMTRVKNQLRNFEKQIKAQKGLSDYYKTGGEAAKAFAKQKEVLNKAIQTQSQVLQKLKKSYDDEIAANGEMSKKAQRLAGHIEDGNAKLARFAIELQEVAKHSYLASSKLNAFGDKMLNFSRGAQKIENGLNTVSQRTQALSLAIFGGMALSAKAAMDFESAFTGVTKTVDETASMTYGRLATGIREMAKELPSSAAEISKVAEVAGQLGIKADDVLAFTRVMIDMGNSTNLSAEDAAVAIAKFQNIVQMAPGDVSRLGSVIVHLGNNMATTERDITDMGLRLASTGKLVGLTEPQIMALAATLSAVGMEAEAGGSAMSRVMQKLNTAVAEGEEKLSSYAAVAGMTAEEFAQTWKTKPTVAITEFLKGMGRVKDAGGDVTQTLKDLGVNSIREIDSLQRLAGAGNLLTEALEHANEAWSEGDKLSIEAQKRYETTASKMEIAKNKVTDLAITLGGPLLDAFLDILDASEPIIDDISEMAKKFSELDKGTQRSIINMALMVGAISPVSKAMSSVVGTVSDLTGGIGNLAKKLANIDADKAGSLAIQGIGDAAIGTNTNLGSLVSTASILGSTPTWGVVLGGAVLAALGYIAVEATNAENRTKLWGTEVNKVQAGELTQLKEKVDDTTKSMELFADGAVEDIKEVEKSVKDLTDSIIALTDEELAKDIELAEKLGLSESVVNVLKQNADKSKTYVQQLSSDILAIYQKHGNDHSKLNAEERAMVNDHMNAMIQEQLRIQGYGKEEQLAIIRAMNGEVSQLNDTQLRKAIETTKTWMADEKTLYLQRKEDLIQLRDSITGTDEDSVQARREINEQLLALESEYTAKMESFQERYIRLRRQTYEADKEAFVNAGKTAEEFDALLAEELKGYGITLEEFKRLSLNATEEIGRNYKLLGKEVVGMTEEARQANQQWRALIWDEQKADLKTNAPEEIQKALAAEGGWEKLEFILKNATIESNAKQMIADALIASGQWDSLQPEQKELVVKGDKVLETIYLSKENLEAWNSIPLETKQLLMESEQFMSDSKLAEEVLQAWNEMSPETKRFISESEGFKTDVQVAIDKILEWNRTSPIEKYLLAKDRVEREALEKLDEWNSLPIELKELLLKTEAFMSDSQKAKDILIAWQEMPNAEKKLLLKDEEFLSSAETAIKKIEEWNSLSPIDKYLRTKDEVTDTALQKIQDWNAVEPKVQELFLNDERFTSNLENARYAIFNWNNTDPKVQELFANNEFFMADAGAAMRLLEIWNTMDPKVQELLLNNEIFMANSDLAMQVLYKWDSYSPKMKELIAQDLTGHATESAQGRIDRVLQYKPIDIIAVDETNPATSSATHNVNAIYQFNPIAINAQDNASWIAENVRNQIYSIPTERTTVLRVVRVGEHNPMDGPAATAFTGTNYHPGGLALVNDQIGPMYKELITLPTGESFIPKGRNVLLDLPRGTKVLNASRTLNLMEKIGVKSYAQGVGYPEDARIFKDIERYNAQNAKNTVVVSSNDTASVKLLREILNVLKAIEDKDVDGVGDVYLGSDKVGSIIDRYQKNNEWLMNSMRGVST
ncbi:TPA: phage tail tape measure protein [Streptococcus suis]